MSSEPVKMWWPKDQGDPPMDVDKVGGYDELGWCPISVPTEQRARELARIHGAEWRVREVDGR